MHFVFTAADYVDTDAALLTGVTYGDEVPPAFMAAGLTIDSYAALIGKLEIRSQNKIALRPDMNSTSGHKSAVITGRRPVMTFDPEETLVATYAFYTKLRTAGNLTAGLEFTIGATAGNIIAVAAGAVQYMKVNPADVNGWRTLGIDCALNRTSGDDEWTITLT